MLVSVVLAVMLFLTATTSNYSNSQTKQSQLLETYSHTLENIPIDIKYDSDKYFISGYSYETEVYLTSINRVKLDLEINSDTRQFKVVADLTRLNEGTSKVPLQIENLSDEVSATVKPVSMSVTIGKKMTKKFPVEVELAEDDLVPGYQINDYSLDINEVNVTSDENNIEQISHVVAKLPDGQTLSGNYAGDVVLQAMTSSGMIVPSVIDPAKLMLNVGVSQLSKQVPVRIEYTGTLDVGVSDVKYELAQQSVTILGTQEALDAVTEIVAKIDTTGVVADTTQTVALSADNVTVAPEQVEVKLTATKKK